MRYTIGKGLLGLLLGMSLAATGCGSSTGTISGKVYYNNTPLKGGNVTFLTRDKKVSRFTEIKEDGSYQIDKMPAGEAVVTVDTSTLKPPQTRMRIPKNTPPPGAQAPPGYKPPDFAEKAKHYVQIPDKYSKPDQSGLTYTVKGGQQDFDIKLQ